MCACIDTQIENSVKEYMKALKKINVSSRYHAVEALADLGHKAFQGREALERVLLKDESALVRKSAALALGRICCTQAKSSILLAAQHDEDQFVREMAEHILETDLSMPPYADSCGGANCGNVTRGRNAPIDMDPLSHVPSEEPIPRKVSRHVAFASSPDSLSMKISEYSIQPYAEVYGVHPRDFDFDADGEKLPRIIDSCAVHTDTRETVHTYARESVHTYAREPVTHLHTFARERTHLGQRSAPMGFFRPHDQYDYSNIF